MPSSWSGWATTHRKSSKLCSWSEGFVWVTATWSIWSSYSSQRGAGGTRAWKATFWKCGCKPTKPDQKKGSNGNITMPCALAKHRPGWERSSGTGAEFGADRKHGAEQPRDLLFWCTFIQEHSGKTEEAGRSLEEIYHDQLKKQISKKKKWSVLRHAKIGCRKREKN